MSTNPKFDDAIDVEVDRALERMAEETSEMFQKRINSLSVLGRVGLLAMVAEQLKMENDQERTAQLVELHTRLKAA